LRVCDAAPLSKKGLSLSGASEREGMRMGLQLAELEWRLPSAMALGDGNCDFLYANS